MISKLGIVSIRIEFSKIFLDFSALRQATTVDSEDEWRRKSVDTSGVLSGFIDSAKKDRVGYLKH